MEDNNGAQTSFSKRRDGLGSKSFIWTRIARAGTNGDAYGGRAPARANGVERNL